MLQDLYFAFARRIVFALLSSGLIAGAVLFWLYKQPVLPVAEKKSEAAMEQTETFSDLFQGGLFLGPCKTAFSLKELENELKADQIEPRPGAQEQKKLKLVLGEQEKIADAGEKIFLTYENGFRFCQKSPLFLVPFFETDGKNNAKAVFQTAIEHRDSKEFLQNFSLPLVEMEDKKPAGFDLEKAVFLFQDAFARQYNLEKKLQKARLFMENGQILYIKEGDFYVYENGIWKKEKNPQKTDDRPLLKISRILPDKMKAEFWEQDSKKILTYAAFKEKNLDQDPENLFQDLKMRTQTQATWKTGRQRLILRKADVVVKKDKWQLLRGPVFNKKLLQDLQGLEFFVVEGIEKQKVFRIRYFDKNRTSFKTVEKKLSKTVRIR